MVLPASHRARQLLALVIAMLGGHLSLDPARGEDFRIQTRVYQGDEKTPVSENLTLFYRGVVYDFLSEPTEITIFDRPRAGKPGRFVLLDPTRQVQTEILLDQVQRFMSNLQLWTASQSDPFLRFLARPEFEEEFNAEENQRTYRSRYMTYRVTAARSNNAETFAQYDHFSDWFVRLNTMLTIKTRAPYGLGRLTVNASLRTRQEVPSRVELIVDGPNRFLSRKMTYRSEHQLTQMLSQSDHARISEVENHLARFPRLELDAYLEAPAE